MLFKQMIETRSAAFGSANYKEVWQLYKIATHFYNPINYGYITMPLFLYKGKAQKKEPLFLSTNRSAVQTRYGKPL
jgi:hypothetical protein